MCEWLVDLRQSALFIQYFVLYSENSLQPTFALHVCTMAGNLYSAFPVRLSYKMMVIELQCVQICTFWFAALHCSEAIIESLTTVCLARHQHARTQFYTHEKNRAVYEIIHAGMVTNKTEQKKTNDHMHEGTESVPTIANKPSILHSNNYSKQKVLLIISPE